jgi:hypothetical protein
MIITKLYGGLGNQMFQYAFGRSLSLMHKTKLFIDLTDLIDRKPIEGFTYRNYELNVFNIEAEFANINQINKIKNSKPHLIDRFKSKLLMKPIPFYRQPIVKELGFEFNDNYRLIRNYSYIDGYWQSEKNFNKFENIIRSDFTFNKPLEGKNKLLADEIKNTLSVSIHVRRGDYVNNYATNKYHGVCSNDYYFEAIKLITNKYLNCTLFFFSDDINWVKNTFDSIIQPVRFIDHNYNKDSYIDMQLMSLCKHNIIANSSFSWWAAWLNKNTTKTIIVPKKWFNVNLVTKDLIPESWIKI